MAPRQAQQATLEENGGADARPVFGGQALQVQIGANRSWITSVAFAGDDLILEFFADAGEVGVVTGDPHQQVTVIFGVLLGLPQDIGIDHIDLQGGTPIVGISPQETLEFVFMFRVAQEGRAEGHGVAAAVGEHIEIFPPIPRRSAALPPKTLPTELTLAVGPWVSAPVEGQKALDRNCPFGAHPGWRPE